jgi:hypothetical protein
MRIGFKVIFGRMMISSFVHAQAPDTLWSQVHGGNFDDNVLSVQQTADGVFIFAGDTRSSGAGVSDAWHYKSLTAIRPRGNHNHNRFSFILKLLPLLEGARCGLVTLKVYDLLGREMKMLVNEVKEVVFIILLLMHLILQVEFNYQLQTGDP